jgi:hypothetical protein
MTLESLKFPLTYTKIKENICNIKSLHHNQMTEYVAKM